MTGKAIVTFRSGHSEERCGKIFTPPGYDFT